MKKIKKNKLCMYLRGLSLIIAAFLLVNSTIISYAKPVVTKFAYTSTTYIKQTHDDGMYADEYFGEVSVRGADWIIDLGYFKYPVSSNITWDVQGDIEKLTISSRGENDSITRTLKKTVRDKWNFGSKTSMKYNIPLLKRNTSLRPNSEDIKY